MIMIIIKGHSLRKHAFNQRRTRKTQKPWPPTAIIIIIFIIIINIIIIIIIIIFIDRRSKLNLLPPTAKDRD